MKKGSCFCRNVQTTGYGDIPGGLWNSGRASKTVPVASNTEKEVREETGLICGKLEHFMNVSGEEVHYVYPNGDEIYAAEEIFLCREFSGQIICQQEEVEKLCFFRMEELPPKEQINPNNYPAIERLRRMMDENHRETI